MAIRGVRGLPQPYEEAYERHSGIRPSMITNACEAFDSTRSPVDWEWIRLVRHGGPSPSRRLEAMIEALRFVDERFTLDSLRMNPETPRGEGLWRLAAREARGRFPKRRLTLTSCQRRTVTTWGCPRWHLGISSNAASDRAAAVLHAGLGRAALRAWVGSLARG